MNIAAGTDPFELFQSWYDEAVAAEINDPDAIALASVDPDGMPSVRMVLLRQWSDEGFFSSPIMRAANPANCWRPARLLSAFTGRACAARFA